MQYLHGSQLSLTANLKVNPGRPPLLGGKELAPVPMRLRGEDTLSMKISDEAIIRKVLKANRFEILYIKFETNTVHIGVKNIKFRSQAQAVGRIASTLQRFTSDDITIANVSFYSQDLQLVSYRVDLEKIYKEQFNPIAIDKKISINHCRGPRILLGSNRKQRFTWGFGPYVTHRLFNPDLPFSMEAGAELEAGYQLMPGLKISGAIRKSVLTNLTENQQRSGSALPRVHTDWPSYDHAGQMVISTNSLFLISKI